MSLGVHASKRGRLLVETRRTGDGGRTEAELVRLAGQAGRGWRPGRLTLTRLHLSWMPGPAARGVPMLDLDLAAVESVEISAGWVTKVVGIRTETHVLRFRTTGAPALAQAIATAAQDARRARTGARLRDIARGESGGPLG